MSTLKLKKKVDNSQDEIASKGTTEQDADNNLNNINQYFY